MNDSAMFFYVGTVAIALAALYSLSFKARPYFTVRESYALLSLALGFAMVHFLAAGSAAAWLSPVNTVLFLALVFAAQRIAGAEFRRNGLGRLQRVSRTATMTVSKYPVPERRARGRVLSRRPPRHSGGGVALRSPPQPNQTWGT